MCQGKSPSNDDQRSNNTVQAWNSFTEVLNNQNTQEEQQEVMDSTLVYLKAYAANNGLTVDVKKALAGVGMEHDDENAEQTDSENEDEGETSDEDGGQEDEATDDSDYDDTAPSKTTSTTTEATGVESYLTKLIIPLSPRFSVDALQQVRDDFVERMQGERVEVQEPNNGPRHMVKMSNAEIALYANIFFVQMWGMPALRRVAAIIRAYNEGSGTFGDGGLATRAKKYGKKKKIPEACRRVVMDLGDCAKYSGKHSVDLNGYYLNVSFYNLYRSYTGLIREIGKGEPTVLKQLEELGVESGRGQTNAARARSFLTASTYSKVDTEKTQAQHKKRIGNNISAAQVLADLYEYHGGKNLAPLLPYNVARQ